MGSVDLLLWLRASSAWPLLIITGSCVTGGHGGALDQRQLGQESPSGLVLQVPHQGLLGCFLFLPPRGAARPQFPTRGFTGHWSPAGVLPVNLKAASLDLSSSGERLAAGPAGAPPTPAGVLSPESRGPAEPPPWLAASSLLLPSLWGAVCPSRLTGSEAAASFLRPASLESPPRSSSPVWSSEGHLEAAPGCEEGEMEADQVELGLLGGEPERDPHPGSPPGLRWDLGQGGVGYRGEAFLRADDGPGLGAKPRKHGSSTWKHRNLHYHLCLHSDNAKFIFVFS